MAEQNNLSQSVLAWPTAFRSYVEELSAEMHRVSWPNWKQVRATTTVVIISVFAFAAYFFVVDQIVSKLVGKIINVFSK